MNILIWTPEFGEVLRLLKAAPQDAWNKSSLIIFSNQVRTLVNTRLRSEKVMCAREIFQIQLHL